MTKRRSRSRPTAKTQSPRHGWALVRLWIFYGLLLLVALLAIWTVYLDNKVRQKFEGKKWSLPARVYAQPLELYQGMDLSAAAFEQELRALGYRFVSNVTAPGQVLKRVSVASSGASYQMHSRGFAFWDKQEPAQRFSVRIEGNQVALLMDIAGADLPLVRLEPQEIGGFYPAEQEDRMLVRLADLPPLLGETLLAVEDKHFLDHHGVSPLAILRAAWVNVRSGDVVQGGSTITQQLVKNFYLSNEQRFFQRKIPEAIMAVLLEVHYSKAEILETYINEVFLGQKGKRAIHGFALGAQHYFRQPLNELDVQELALLVGLVKGASYYNPWRNPERARTRRNLVLDVMHREGLIDKVQLDKAKASPLGVVEAGQVSATTYPAFMDLVKRQLRQEYQEEDLRSEGLRIFTSLSPRVQRQAEETLSQRVNQLAKGYKQPELQGAMLVTSVGTGEILAVVSDKNPRFEGFNRVLDAKRQIGSLMKPFVYLAALDIPQQYHLGSIISDAPVSYKSGGKWWAPQNADKQDHGDVPLYSALAHSYNQATARLGMTLGLDRVIKTVKQAGYNGNIPAVPAILLGSVEMSPLEVAGIYHTLAADGVYAPVHAIREVLAADGKPLKRYPLELQQRFDARAAFLIQEALHLAITEGTGKSVRYQLPPGMRLAGKTGTTNDQRDSWFAGFSGEHLAVVWMGRDDNQQTPFSGATGALQAWADFMKATPTRGLEAEPPSGVSYIWLDKVSGKLSSETCQGAVYLPVRSDFLPLQAAPCQESNPIKNFWQKLVN
ncbi:penicillin-binding protein 1B [Cellvibrio japonicus]|uniref:Penicillin-binding protein 1B n=1 Tax=Cellvibrio japonicus (strain Ueda107) TaxID=498211 RepID=B3PJQ1_CELJU|nr:penicillin-binding protein 1B [Cellvibrio japonicus]ACE84928.1 murein polymerase, putative, gt51C [Cellvibrio japonicus Ueda107]QEI11330.1 penicillin-binding protein 1B [Cellvibrio japonicus]QEI14904.1 penicillin-binding protein 1B [Cellvibrio japonicus]QEI18484.1 penicillin-binding protein 1B [Cellvibrio japonicus]